jgi:hypothetical protein
MRDMLAPGLVRRWRAIVHNIADPQQSLIIGRVQRAEYAYLTTVRPDGRMFGIDILPEPFIRQFSQAVHITPTRIRHDE